MRLGLLSTKDGERFRRNRINLKTLSKVNPNENAYASSSWKRYESRSVHTKSTSIFGVTENEAKWKRTTRFFLLEQFHKNNEAQICPKIKNKLRTIEARLLIQM